MRIFARPLETIYNSGCRVETLLVLMGVMGFLGDLRGRNSKSPPNPLGLAERVPRPQAVEGVPSIAFMRSSLLFSDAHWTYEAYEAYEAYEE